MMRRWPCSANAPYAELETCTWGGQVVKTQRICPAVNEEARYCTREPGHNGEHAWAGEHE